MTRYLDSQNQARNADKPEGDGQCEEGEQTDFRLQTSVPPILNGTDLATNVIPGNLNVSE